MHIRIFPIHFQITLWFWILIFNIQNFYFRLRGDDVGCRLLYLIPLFESSGDVWQCLTVLVLYSMSPCILLFLHLQMVGRTDGNPNLINYNRNILDQRGLTRGTSLNLIGFNRAFKYFNLRYHQLKSYLFTYFIFPDWIILC